MRRVWILTILLLAGLIIAGCTQEKSSIQQAQATTDADGIGLDLSIVNVRTVAAELSSMTEQVTVRGQTLAERDVVYSAEVAGRLEALKVDLGDAVKKGQVLARVDYQMLNARAEQAQASFDLARKTYERLNILKQDELVTQQIFDEAQAQMDQAKAQLNSAQINLKQSVIRSTTDGIVAQKFAETGEYVGPGSPVVRVVDYRTILVEASLPERVAPRVEKDSPVHVKIDVLDQVFEGSVQVVIPTSDPVSRTFLVRVEVPNSDGHILVGMAATLTVSIAEHTDVIVVSQDVVVEENGSRAVFVEEAGISRKCPVELGPTQGENVLIRKGITPGDQLIVVGQRDLVDGQPVRVVRG